MPLGQRHWELFQNPFSHARAQDLVEEGHRRAPLVRSLLDQKENTLAICQSWRLFVQILAATCMSIAMLGLGFPWWASLLMTVLVLGVLLLIFATFAGMRVGQYRPEATALWLSKMVSFRANNIGSVPPGRMDSAKDSATFPS